MFLKDEDVQKCLFLHPEVGNEVIRYLCLDCCVGLRYIISYWKRLLIFQSLQSTLSQLPFFSQSSRSFYDEGNLTEVSASLGCANVKTIHVPFPGISKTTR